MKPSLPPIPLPIVVAFPQPLTEFPYCHFHRGPARDQRQISTMDLDQTTQALKNLIMVSQRVLLL